MSLSEDLKLLFVIVDDVMAEAEAFPIMHLVKASGDRSIAEVVLIPSARLALTRLHVFGVDLIVQ